MSYIPTLVASLDARLAELTSEISTLQDRRAALQKQAVQAPRTTRSATPARRARGSTANPKTPAVTSALSAPAPNPGPATKTAAKSKSRAPSPRRQTSASSASTRRAKLSLPDEQLDRLLTEARSGLSAATIAERSGVAHSRVLARLRELEASGTVTRTGQRRSTLWRLVTDEDRIAERAAELERQFASRRGDRTQRRGRARAS
jgi:DNA-binding transcriptional ArsR family regulator